VSAKDNSAIYRAVKQSITRSFNQSTNHRLLTAEVWNSRNWQSLAV